MSLQTLSTQSPVITAERCASADQTKSDLPRGCLGVLSLSRRTHEQFEEAYGHPTGWLRGSEEVCGEFVKSRKIMPIQDYYKKMDDSSRIIHTKMNGVGGHKGQTASPLSTKAVVKDLCDEPFLLNS